MYEKYFKWDFSYFQVRGMKRKACSVGTTPHPKKRDSGLINKKLSIT